MIIFSNFQSFFPNFLSFWIFFSFFFCSCSTNIIMSILSILILQFVLILIPNNLYQPQEVNIGQSLMHKDQSWNWLEAVQDSVLVSGFRAYQIIRLNPMDGTANENCLASQNSSKPLSLPLHILIQFSGRGAQTIIRSNWAQGLDCLGGIQVWHTSGLCTPIWWHLLKSPGDRQTSSLQAPFPPFPLMLSALQRWSCTHCSHTLLTLTLTLSQGNSSFLLTVAVSFVVFFNADMILFHLMWTG